MTNISNYEVGVKVSSLNPRFISRNVGQKFQQHHKIEESITRTFIYKVVRKKLNNFTKMNYLNELLQCVR